MIKTLIKLKMFKFALVGGALAAYAFKKYRDQKKQRGKKVEKTLILNR